MFARLFSVQFLILLPRRLLALRCHRLWNFQDNTCNFLTFVYPHASCTPRRLAGDAVLVPAVWLELSDSLLPGHLLPHPAHPQVSCGLLAYLFALCRILRVVVRVVIFDVTCGTGWCAVASVRIFYPVGDRFLGWCALIDHCYGYTSFRKWDIYD
jgi:hypothetical protein